MGISRGQRIRMGERRERVRTLLTTRASDRAIAATLSAEFGHEVSHDTVRRDRIAIMNEWREGLHEDFEAVQARELADLEAMEREAALAYERTRHPRLLRLRLDVKDRRIKLIGLDSASIRYKQRARQMIETVAGECFSTMTGANDPDLTAVEKEAYREAMWSLLGLGLPFFRR